VKEKEKGTGKEGRKKGRKVVEMAVTYSRPNICFYEDCKGDGPWLNGSMVQVHQHLPPY